MDIDLKLDWATHEAAKYACEKWHYSKCLPSGSLVKIGVWENKKYIGCVLFSRGATPNLCKPYGLKQTECCELTRIALAPHKTAVSRIIKIALIFFKKQNPGIKLIVSFADDAQNHHGGIYQAGNWIYSGSAKLDQWMINGKKMHPRSVVAKWGTRSVSVIKKIDPLANKIWGIKHRYLMPLDDNIKKEVLKFSKPYPKRVEHEVNASSFHEGESGSTPTDALQTQKT